MPAMQLRFGFTQLVFENSNRDKCECRGVKDSTYNMYRVAKKSVNRGLKVFSFGLPGHTCTCQCHNVNACVIAVTSSRTRNVTTS
jgi:hypothetical protein